MIPEIKGQPLSSDDIIKFLHEECATELKKITDTTGVWTYEKGLKQAYEKILHYIESYEEKRYL